MVNSNASKSRPELIYELQKSWGEFRATIGNEDVVAMRDKLKEIFFTMSRHSILAQLILVDDEKHIIFTLSTPVPEWTKEVKRAWNDYSISLVGTHLERREGALHTGLLGGSFENNFLVCIRVNKLKNGYETLAGGYYDVFPLKLSAKTTKDIILKPVRENLRLYLAIEEKLVSEINPWFERMIVVPYSWPQAGNLPGIAGALLFPLDPNDDLRSSLLSLADELSLLTMFFQSTTFTFQTYALAQATAEKPTRLSDELSLNDLGKLIAGLDLSENENEIKQVVNTMNILESDFVKKRLMRMLFYDLTNKPFLNSILREYYSGILKKNKIDTFESCKEIFEELSLILSSLEGGLFDSNQLGVIVRLVLLSHETFIEWPLDSLEKIRICQLGLSILEDVYFNNDANIELQHEICDVYERILDLSINNFNLSERLIASLLVIFSKSNEAVNKQLIDLLNLAFSTWDSQNKKPLEIADNLFSVLEPTKRRFLLENTISENSEIHNQLLRVHQRQNQITEIIKTRGSSLDPLEMISVVSTKGGVGKSSIALILASYLAGQPEKSEKVCLIDLDFFGPTLTYVVERQGVSVPPISLNEFIWARYLPELKDRASTDQLAMKTMNGIFKNKSYWENRFSDFSTDENLLDKVLVDSPLPGLSFITCSRNEKLQELMLPFLGSIDTHTIISEILYNLIYQLRKLDFGYIIFDSPAELKELALVTTELSSMHGGKNLFVTSLSSPSLHPILEMLTTDFYAQGKNYLLFNKLRSLDYKYSKDKQALADYLIAWRHNQEDLTCPLSSSKSLLDISLNIRQCGFVPWTEHLNSFLSETHTLKGEDYKILLDKVGKHLEFILHD